MTTKNTIDFDIPLNIPTEIKIPPKLETEQEETEEESDDEESEQRKQTEEEIEEDGKIQKMVKMLGDDDDDMPHEWNLKDASDLEDDQDSPSNPKGSQEDIHKSSQDHYAEKLASARKMMDDTHSFEQDSKSDISKVIKDSKNVSKITDRSKLTDRSKVSNKEKAPQPKLNKKYDADDAVEFSDDDEDEIMSDDYAEKVKEIKSIGNKQVSEEWNPNSEQKFTDKLVELYLKDKSQLTNDEKRLAEQQLMLKKHYSGVSKSHYSSSGETESLRKPSPVMEKAKSKSNVQKKLTVVRETTDPSDDVYTPREYSEYKNNDPEPKFDDKGKLKFEFQDQDLPELDVNMLAKIRDQLLLQKMYENDLEKFKKFKKTKGKKGKSKARGHDNHFRNCKLSLIMV